MKPYLIVLLISTIFACEKPGDELSDLPDPPENISVNKSRVLFDYFFRIDTITVEVEGEWQVNVEPYSRWLTVSKLDAFPNRFITYARDEVTDGIDRTAKIIVRPVNSADTTAVYIPATRLAIPKDTLVYGGDGNDRFNGILLPGDNKRIAVGYSESSDGDLSGNRGGKDCWVVKFDEKGQKLWSKSFGGSQDDVATSVVAMYRQEDMASYPDGFLIGGYTYSNDGDITGNHGQKDAFLIKIDTLGNIVWKRILGTTGNDEITTMFNGSSPGPLVSGIKDGDQWLIKLDAGGNVEWEKTFGSSGPDFAGSFVETMEGYFFTGSGKMQDGDVSDKPTSSYDAWIVKMSKEGEIKWIRYIAGSADEKGIFLGGDYNGNILAIGTTESNDIFPEFNGTHNIFAAKYDGLGNLLWKKIIKHTSWDEPMVMSSTRSGNLIIAGKSQSPGSVTNDENSFDASILVVSPTGEVLLSRMFGGPGPDGITAMSATKFNQPFVGYSSGGKANTDIDGYFGWFEYR